MDMRFYWVCDHSQQGHFTIFWRLITSPSIIQKDIN
jgi:hypothetical protein